MNARSLAVAKYILDRCKTHGDGAVTPMQLLKLVYMAHGWMLGLAGRPLLDEPVAAWRYGPVVPSLYQAIRGYGSNPVQNVPLFSGADVQFDDTERSIMDQVADIYGGYTGIQLSSMTHEAGTPWDIAWRQSGQNTTISNDLIEQFYRQKAQASEKSRGH
ncbi:Panacea domain-containing protein [Dyella amyloliquefaciens]|uniref:Panacea domain-containing protein n=1 Tax=Dyella amyloliquefaciens TaxID=1770545 RepID=UPI00102E4AD8|nr:type II toxin-antitoxin system antitoxin SocA domain-containing protein [Dyella amyloliquefaciens]